MTRFAPLAVLVLAASLLSININKPFIGQHDWNGVVYGQQAKNFVRFGYFPLKFGATLATFDTPAKERKFSTHYTPVLPILISFSYRLFGVSEWSTRLVPVLASLASVFLVMLLGKELVSFRAGIIAGVLMSVTPMFIYYGKNPVHEVVLLPFALLSFYSYWRWRWISLLISLTAAMLIGWPGYYAAGLITIYGFLTEKYSKNSFQKDYFTIGVRSDIANKLKNRKFSFIFSLLFCSDRTLLVKSMSKFLLPPVIMAGLFLIFLIYQFILNPLAGKDLIQILAARIGGGGFGLIEFISKELRYAVNLFTAVILGLSAIWLVKLGIGTVKKNLSPAQSFLACIGLFGILHILLFPQAGWYHEYLLFPLLPFAALSTAAVVEKRSKLLILAIVILASVERAGYAKALLKSEYVRDVHKQAVDFAKEKRWKTERIPRERDVYFIFYADRENI